MPPRRKEEYALPPLKPRRPAVREVIIPTPEDPKFYGAAYAALITTNRKTGTLREKNLKRAGLTKGMFITGHVHETAEEPSILDPRLVILDVYHGRLSTVYKQHPLAFLLDGITSLNEAVTILQNFSQDKVTPATEIDYLTFTYEPLFRALPETEQTRLLDLPIEQAIINPAFAHIFFPTLCQTLVWHGANFDGWLKFLVSIKATNRETANKIYHYSTPGFGFDNLELHDLVDKPMYGLQSLLEEYDPKIPNRAYEMAVLCKLDACNQRIKTLSSRYLLIPDHNQQCAVVDQAAGNTIVKFVSEQEAEVLIMDSERAGWDRKYCLSDDN